MRYKDLHRLLGSYGYEISRMSKHIIYTNGLKSLSVPHTKEVSTGTLRDILTVVTGDRESAKALMREVA